MRRALRWVGIIVAILAIAIGGVWYSAFGSNSPIVDGQTLVPGVETVKDGFVSVFILDVGQGKVALIDAGNDSSGKAILAALSRRGLSADAVSAILLTHGHGDHTAGCKAFPSAKVYAMESELSLVGTAANVGVPLHDGDVPLVGELRVEVFAVPGHTPGSAVFFARGVLFFGDSAGASKDGALMKAVSLFSKDSTLNVVSLRMLEAKLLGRASEVKKLAFAHTGPLEGFQPLVTFASK